jgi:putative copper export protein
VSYAIRYLDLLFLFGILGLIIVELGIAQGVVATARGATFARIGATGLIITGFIQALSFTAELTESSLVNALGGITTALGTTPGAMFYMQPLLATLLIALFRKGSWTSHRTDATLVISTLGMFLIARAYTGHPRSEGLALLGIPLDIVHTAAAAAWLGGLAILLTCVVSAVATQDGVRAFQAFGRMADFAVPAILVTGFIQTLNMHGGIGTIMSTTHGRVLFAKLTFVGVMLAVGFVNRRRLRHMRPIQNGSPTTLGRLIRASVVETGIGVAVVAVTAVLVSTSLN